MNGLLSKTKKVDSPNDNDNDNYASDFQEILNISNPDSEFEVDDEGDGDENGESLDEAFQN